MNRGVARRPIFESEQDVRVFLCLLARRVRAGELELHAYSVLTTHFHLLVRSTVGELSHAMMQVEAGYARWFNDLRERDGPLFRGRFCSKHIGGAGYLRNVVRYIDHNSVGAGLASSPGEYPYGSARHYLRGGRAPAWLSTAELERRAAAAVGGGSDEPRAYARAFGAAPSPGASWVIAQNIGCGSAIHRADRSRRGPIAMSTIPGLRKLVECSLNADGIAGRWAVAAPDTIESHLRNQRERYPGWRHAMLRGHHDLWTVLGCALRHELCCESVREISRNSGVSLASAGRFLGLHALLARIDATYRERFESACRECASEVFASDDI